MLEITNHFYGAMAAIAATLVLGLLWRTGRLPAVSRPVAVLVGLGLVALALLGNGQQGAMSYRLLGGLHPVLMTPAAADAAETAAGWMLEQPFIDAVGALPSGRDTCGAVDADALRARVTAKTWRYREAHDRFGITITPPPPDGTPLVVLEYVDVQNWVFSVFDGGAVDRRQFCLADLSRYETALQIVALLGKTTDAEVQARALMLLGAESIGDIAALIRPRLDALAGKMASPEAEAALTAQRARVAPPAG